jgi:hypothetical protein
MTVSAGATKGSAPGMPQTSTDLQVFIGFVELERVR